ncbi:hypothetical protein HPMKM6_0916, partial [Helicobacter pylori]
VSLKKMGRMRAWGLNILSVMPSNTITLF